MSPPPVAPNSLNCHYISCINKLAIPDAHGTEKTHSRILHDPSRKEKDISMYSNRRKSHRNDLCDNVLAGSKAHLAAATGRSRLHTLALTDLHGGLVVHSGGAHAFFDLAGHGEESLLDVRSVLGRGL